MGNVEWNDSKAKVQLKMGASRIKLQQSKKNNAIRIMKREIAELIDKQKEESARIRTESLVTEENYMKALEILLLFTELLHNRVGLINASKKCPKDLIEPIATLVFCVKRMPEIPEFQEFAKLIAGKYSMEWTQTHVDNKSKTAHRRVVQYLSVRPPPEDFINRKIEEVCKEHEIEWVAPKVIPAKVELTPKQKKEKEKAEKEKKKSEEKAEKAKEKAEKAKEKAEEKESKKTNDKMSKQMEQMMAQQQQMMAVIQQQQQQISSMAQQGAIPPTAQAQPTPVADLSDEPGLAELPRVPTISDDADAGGNDFDDLEARFAKLKQEDAEDDEY